MSWPVPTTNQVNRQEAKQMSHGNVIRLSPGERVDDPTSHAIVAAQLRGEASTDDDASPADVIDAVACAIEDLGLEPDRSELGRRYGCPSGVQARQLTKIRTSA